MDDNPLARLRARGQSVWLEEIHRRMLADGTLARLIASDGLAGLTSNAGVFARAITTHAEYQAAVAELRGKIATVGELYDAIVLDDIRRAADLFRIVHERTRGRDGFVCVGVSPHLAYDAQATIVAARQLRHRLERTNVMIKVPATRAGLAASRALIAEGISVNVTLLGSPERYRAAAEAYLGGLEERIERGGEPDAVASVATFYVSRIDALVDRELDEHAGQGRGEARALRGRAATALADRAYELYRQGCDSPRWRTLAARGAQPQRLLWASASTKDPRFGDLRYVESLIAPETVITLSLETLAAYRDHGKGGIGLGGPTEDTGRVLRGLAALGIDLDRLAEQHETEGVRALIEPFDEVQRWLEARSR
ncbi:MAG TPA: transaldolase [Steroidobacteraceae bacterium]|nr:transaldolase [Steroidobacteraceae bacterium]